MTDTPIPYALAHVWCCECSECLNGPIPYKLTSAGKTYTPSEEKAELARRKAERERRAG